MIHNNSLFLVSIIQLLCLVLCQFQIQNLRANLNPLGLLPQNQQESSSSFQNPSYEDLQSNNNNHQKRDSQTQPIKITIKNYGCSKQYSQYSDIIKEVVSQFQRFVYVYPKIGSHQLRERNSYGQPDCRQYKSNEKSDLHISVEIYKFDSMKPDTIASAGPCMFNKNGRPISGTLLIFTDFFSKFNRDQQISVLKHEIFHIFGIMDEPVRSRLAQFIQTGYEIKSPNMMKYINQLQLGNIFSNGIPFQQNDFSHFHYLFSQCGEIMVGGGNEKEARDLTKLSGMLLKDLNLYDEIKTDLLPDLKCPPSWTA